jgi:Holliday junction resolvasome RuvABC endonuclease subunit
VSVVVGLDLSSSSAGICAAGECSTVKPKGDLLERCREIAAHVQPVALSAHLIVVEDIPPSAKSARTLIALATVHALVFDRLHGLLGPDVVKPNQSAVKKYATGKGNSDKDAVLLAAERAGVSTVNNNDEADAFWLYAIGRHLIGDPVVDTTQYRADVIAALNEKAATS